MKNNYYSETGVVTLKNYFKKLNCEGLVMRNLSLTFSITIIFLMNVFSANAQFLNVPCTGYNADVVGNGVGAGTTSTTADVDGAAWIFVSTTFNPGSGICAAGATALPATNVISSLTTAGLNYTLQPYNANNSLRLTSGSSGTLTLTSPTQAANIYLLATGGSGACTITGTLNFSDLSTQPISGTAGDWCSGVSAATTVFYRIQRADITCTGGTCQYLYDVNLAVLSANYGKTISSISITSTGGILNVMGVGMKVQCAVPTAQVTAPSLTPISISQINGSFTAAAGAPSGYLVVRYPAGSPEILPSNGTTYTTGQSITGGAGIVVQSSATTTFSATGLSGSTNYDFYVYSFNTGATCGGPIYLTTGGLLGTQATASCVSALPSLVPIGPTAPASPNGFVTITSALTYINANGLAGATVLELQTDYVPASETFPITFPLNPCINAGRPLTIRPAAAVASAFTWTSTSTLGTVVFDGGSYITIDGRPGGVGTNQFIIIKNTSSTAAAAGNAVLLRSEASNNILTYLDLQASNLNPAGNTGTVTLGAVPGVVAVLSTAGTGGNDNNTISFCNIHSATAAGNILNVGVYAYNATTVGNPSNNDNNTITGCNIYDCFHATTATAGIDILVGNNNWTITNNSFYKSAALAYTYTAAVVQRGFWITPGTGASSSGFIITGNFIGGTAPVCGGAAYTNTAAVANIFDGIDISVGTASITSLQNNTIANINMTNASTSSTAMVGINIANGNVDIGTTTGNVIGSNTVAGSITYTTSLALGGFIGIRTGGGTTINISNNTVSGITVLGNSVSITPSFNGINDGGGTTVNITNNTVGSTTLTNSINASTAYTGASAQSIRGIIVNGGTTSTVIGNTIANMNTEIVSTGAQATTLVGIAVSIGTSTVSNNTIRNLTSATQTTASGSTSAINGIAYTSTTAPMTITGNNIYALRLTNAALAAAAQITGISVNGPTSGTNIVSKNNLHNFSLASTTNVACTFTGITVAAGAANYVNNMISLGYDESGSSIVAGILLRGFTKGIALTNNFYHNSVFIGGTGVISSTQNTFAFQRSTAPSAAPNDDIRDNIFVNNRSNASGTAKHYQFSAVANTLLTLNYNVYYGNGTGAVFGLNVATDVPIYTPGWFSGDVNSWANDPRFINPTGNSTLEDLHINPSLATPVEGLGINIATVTDDYDNQTRSTLTPVDIGADAGNFTGFSPCAVPGNPTGLSLTPISISQINGTFAASGADNYIVVRYISPAGTITPPVNGTSYIAGSSLGAGTVVSVASSPSFSATGLFGGTAYDFYVYALNNNCTGGPLYSTPGINGTASTLSCAGLSGIIPVGPTAPPSPAGFPSLTSALAYLTSNGLAASTYLELQSNYLSSAEPSFPITIGTYPCISPFKTLTIRPATGANGLVITGANAGPTIDFNGAMYVTIDGTPGGTSGAPSLAVTAAGSNNATLLNIANTNATGSAIRFTNSAGIDTVKYCDLQGQNTINANVPATIAGVIYFENIGVNGNDNIIVDHCNIHSTTAAAFPSIGIYSQGTNITTGYSVTSNDNNIITNNNIYDFSSTTTNAAGLELNFGNNAWTITGNSFFQTASRSVANTFYNRAIWLIPFRNAGNVGNGFNVSSNYIGGSQPLCAGTPYTLTTAGFFEGIRLETTDISSASPVPTSIQGNTIRNFNITTTITGDPFHGAVVFAGAGNVNIGTISGNTFGSATATGDITINAGSGAHTIITGVLGGGSATTIYNINNNIIGGITMAVTNPANFSGIFVNQLCVININNNKIGSETVLNSINALNASTTTQFVRAISIQNSNANNLAITNNIISNLNNATTSTTSGAQVAGIIQAGTTTLVQSISGNIIKNLTCASASTATGINVAVLGIG
ncbi:MAG: hypothetical protein ABI723_06790, partial [Bacteroidia bacterium]